MQIVFRGLCAFVEWSSADKNKNGRFTVVMPKSGMEGMPNMPRHHASLCVPITSLGAATQEPMSIVPSGMLPSDAQWQPYGTPLAVWDLEGCELSIQPSPAAGTVDKTPAVGYKSLLFLPALADANHGDDLVDPNFIVGAAPTMTARVQLAGGSIAAGLPAHPLMTCKKWSFGSRTDVGFTDQVMYNAPAADTYTLVISDLSGKKKPVQVQVPLAAQLFVTHLATTATKLHFQMYWSLLIKPNVNKPVPQDGQPLQITGVTGLYPGDCLNSYAHVRLL
jgi:hypothetical protein